MARVSVNATVNANSTITGLIPFGRHEGKGLKSSKIHFEVHNPGDIGQLNPGQVAWIRIMVCTKDGLSSTDGLAGSESVLASWSWVFYENSSFPCSEYVATNDRQILNEESLYFICDTNGCDNGFYFGITVFGTIVELSELQKALLAYGANLTG